MKHLVINNVTISIQASFTFDGKSHLDDRDDIFDSMKELKV